MSESAEFELPTQEDFRCDLRALCLGAIRLTLEMLLDEEVRTLVGAGRWQRLKWGARTCATAATCAA